MSDGYQAAREQRNWLERLAERIPGFRGFQDRELRRDVDKQLREHLAEELTAIKSTLRGRALTYTDAGRLDALTLFDRLDRRLDGLERAVRFADYGTTGLFDVDKIDEADLERLYRFDLSVLDDLSALAAAIKEVPPPATGAPVAELEEALNRLGELEAKWGRREAVANEVAGAHQA